jgi:hypothetical protein
MSYEYMAKKANKLAAEIRDLLEEAEKLDRAEDHQHGKDKRGDEIPEELRRRESRLRKIEAAMAELEAEAAAARARKLKKKAQEAREKVDEAPPDRRDPAVRRATRASGKAGAAVKKANKKADAAGRDRPDLNSSPEIPLHEVPTDSKGDPTPKAQRNFTDSDSRIMVTNGEFVQGYNCQAAVDADNQIIVAHAATNQPQDRGLLQPMLAKIEEFAGALPKKASADCGYRASISTSPRSANPTDTTSRFRGDGLPKA